MIAATMMVKVMMYYLCKLAST